MRGHRLAWIASDDPPGTFPPVHMAFDEPNGLLAAGGDLSPERVLSAYQRGIFPWYEDGQPILWWSPDPRCVFMPQEFRLSRRMHRLARRDATEVTFNRAFTAVIAACAAPRRDLPGTWITAEMRDAYVELHRLGWAHSVEIWRAGRLVGGLYGLAIGRVFFGESMFSRESNASKFALFAACRRLAASNFTLFDCQTVSRHLLSLGAELMARDRFTEWLARDCFPADRYQDWPQYAAKIADLAGDVPGRSLQ